MNVPTRAQIAAESGKATAKDNAAAQREEADALKYFRVAEAEADRARIDAGNARSDALVALELGKARLEAMPGIIAEMVKPAEKIKGISINHIGGGSVTGSDGTLPINQAVSSIMDMAVQIPALNEIGKAVGVNIAESIDPLVGNIDQNEEKTVGEWSCDAGIGNKVVLRNRRRAECGLLVPRCWQASCV